MKDKGAKAVADALQRYADRGIFRGYSTTHPGERLDFRFAWLTRHPSRMTYDPKTGALTFKDLLPAAGVRSPIVAELQRLIVERTARDGLEHRRIDPRRARVECSTSRGRTSLVFTVR